MTSDTSLWLPRYNECPSINCLFLLILQIAAMELDKAIVPSAATDGEITEHGMSINVTGTTSNNEDIIVCSPEVSSSHIEGLPHCQPELTHVVGLKFATLEEGLEFYKNYAKVFGFGTRFEGEKRSKKIMEAKGGSVVGVVLNKRIVCNKEGKSKMEATVRRTSTIRVGRDARVDFKRVAETRDYVVSCFIEKHNHAMVTPNTMVHLKPGRNLNMIHKK